MIDTFAERMQPLKLYIYTFNRIEYMSSVILHCLLNLNVMLYMLPLRNVMLAQILTGKLYSNM